jgi:hypothetical protein
MACLTDKLVVRGPGVKSNLSREVGRLACIGVRSTP